MTRQEAIQHIEALYPPDSEYPDTAEIGKNLMDWAVGNLVGYKNWRDMTDDQLIRLAQANIDEHDNS